jgi:hypothetical protein
VCTRQSTASAKKAELTRQVHGAEREKGTRGATARRLVNRAHEAERESERAKETGADRSAPLGSEREREGTHEGEPACQAARARGLAGLSWASWAAFSFSFSLDFLIPFLFLFYIGFSNPNSN